MGGSCQHSLTQVMKNPSFVVEKRSAHRYSVYFISLSLDTRRLDDTPEVFVTGYLVGLLQEKSLWARLTSMYLLLSSICFPDPSPQLGPDTAMSTRQPARPHHTHEQLQAGSA